MKNEGSSYIRIRSSLLDGEIIVLAFNRTQEVQASKDYPDLVIYYQSEIEALKGLYPHDVKILHFAKKEFGGPISELNKTVKKESTSKRTWKF